MDYIEKIYKKPKAWYDWRRRHVTASDAGVILSGNDDEVIRLWREKRGEIEPEDLSNTIPVLIGTVTEPLNLCLFERHTGLTITRHGEQIESEELSFAGCTLDGWVEDEKAIVEAKHSNPFGQWDDLVRRYFPQVQHQMFVSGAGHAYLSVLIGNLEHKIERIDWDPFYCEALIEAEREFWLHVQNGTPPRALPPPTIKFEAITRIVDMTGSNVWASEAVNWVDNKDASITFDKAAKALKALVEADVKTAHGHGVVITRSKRGLSISAGKL